MPEMIKRSKEEYVDFLSRLSLMKHEAATLGLWEAHHAIDDAQSKAGWQVAKLLEEEMDNDDNQV